MKQKDRDHPINKRLTIQIDTKDFECRLIKHGPEFTALYLEGEIMTRISPTSTSAMRVDFFLPFERPIPVNDQMLNERIDKMLADLPDAIGCVGGLPTGTSTFVFEEG